MPRLIEVPDASEVAGQLTVRVGDVLWFSSIGGRLTAVGTDAGAVQLLGPFVSSVLGPSGQIVSPAGPPNAFFVVALRVGCATLEVMSGDAYHGQRAVRLQVNIES